MYKYCCNNDIQFDIQFTIGLQLWHRIKYIGFNRVYNIYCTVYVYLLIFRLDHEYKTKNNNRIFPHGEHPHTIGVFKKKKICIYTYLLINRYGLVHYEFGHGICFFILAFLHPSYMISGDQLIEKYSKRSVFVRNQIYRISSYHLDWNDFARYWDYFASEPRLLLLSLPNV